MFSPQTLNISSINKNKSQDLKNQNKKENSNKLNSNCSLLPMKLDFNNTNYQNKNELDYLSDEYSGLSYLNMPNCDTTLNNKGVKKYSDFDYRGKYKTEKCKFWEIHMACKFGDNVI